MGRRTYPECNASESWHDRVGYRGESSRSERVDRLSLRWWRPIRACRRKSAKNGLQKRALNGWRLQSWEKGRLASDEMTRARQVDFYLPHLPAAGLVYLTADG